MCAAFLPFNNACKGHSPPEPVTHRAAAVAKAGRVTKQKEKWHRSRHSSIKDGSSTKIHFDNYEEYVVSEVLRKNINFKREINGARDDTL